MKKQLFCLYTMLLLVGALLLPVNVRAADQMSLATRVEQTSTIALANPCATTTTATTSTGTVSVQSTGGCGDAATPAGVSWNSGGG
jgi:hypothetical protein